MSRPDLFKGAKQAWLEKCRDEARKQLRYKLTITSEDVTAVCPRPKYLHPNATGGIFHDVDFEPVGYALARRTSSHRRLIRRWALKNAVPQRSKPVKVYDDGD